MELLTALWTCNEQLNEQLIKKLRKRKFGQKLAVIICR